MISGVLKHFADGEDIFKQGDAADSMYVVRRGKVRIYRDHDGTETTLATFNAGEFFGEMGLFDRKPRSAAAQVIGATDLEVIAANELRTALGGGLVWEILQQMSSRIRETNETIEKLSVQESVRRESLANLPIRRGAYF